jgi:hypothetical protein
MESPCNSLLTIKFPKNHITSSNHRNLPKIAKAIFGHQRALGVKGQLGGLNIIEKYNRLTTAARKKELYLNAFHPFFMVSDNLLALTKGALRNLL